MTFNWDVPPWQRQENCTYMAAVLTHSGGGKIDLAVESLRGNDATEALADLLMTGPMGKVIRTLPLVGVVVRRGIDVMWMANPGIEARAVSATEWEIGVAEQYAADATLFSAEQTLDLLAQLEAQYSAS